MLKEKQSRWLTPPELELEYGISQSTQSKYRMKKNNKIPFSKIGSKFIRYDRRKIDKWLEDNDVNS
jgi:predicted DNA-binding transcriptional regulator AlpA